MTDAAYDHGARLVAFGPCVICGYSFAFDADLVPSVCWDPVLNRPPDVTADGRPIDPDLATKDRWQKRPLCPDCVGLVNAARAKQGRDPIPVLAGAYGPQS